MMNADERIIPAILVAMQSENNVAPICIGVLHSLAVDAVEGAIDSTNSLEAS